MADDPMLETTDRRRDVVDFMTPLVIVLLVLVIALFTVLFLISASSHV